MTEEPQAPGLFARSWNFTRAVVRHMADGAALVPDDEYAARLGACGRCRLLDPERRVCRHPACGCFVDVKASWRSESCPAKRWPLETTQPPASGTGGCGCGKAT